MDQIKTGRLIRALRQAQGLTQRALAGRIGVSDKAVSKWERGCGAPDIALLPQLSQALQVDLHALLRGALEENDMTNGNLNKLRIYVCPDCGNLLFSTDEASVSCCGRALTPLQAQPADEAHALSVTESDGEWFVTAAHEMRREHYISFVALRTGDTLLVRKQYPEWGLETRLPLFSHGTLLWYCTRHGLFSRRV
ncbi:MAG: helix-turn-helix domain-containing protein [Clostridiales bacterium]|nr:helix-turn-helix domain-containing protein [Clostridiales bacterium]